MTEPADVEMTELDEDELLHGRLWEWKDRGDDVLIVDAPEPRILPPPASAARLSASDGATEGA